MSVLQCARLAPSSIEGKLLAAAGAGSSLAGAAAGIKEVFQIQFMGNNWETIRLAVGAMPLTA